MNNYSEYHVPKSLSLFIKKIWTLDNLEGPNPIVDKGALPNGCFNIAIISGNGLEISHKNNIQKLNKGTYFCGQMTESLGIEIFPYSKATMIQLYPWTPAYFTHQSMHNYSDRIFSTQEIINEIDIKVGASCGDICRELAKRWWPYFRENQLSLNIHLATSMIMVASGEITIDVVATNMECSMRYIQKLFKKTIGLSPKKFADIIRLRNIVDSLAFGEKSKLNLTSLAISNNFYDQAHFTNAFRNMFKTTPKQFNNNDFFLSYLK